MSSWEMTGRLSTTSSRCRRAASLIFNKMKAVLGSDHLLIETKFVLFFNAFPIVLYGTDVGRQAGNWGRKTSCDAKGCLMYSFETIPPPERADVARNSLASARNSTFDSVCCIAVELLLNFRVEIQNAYMWRLLMNPRETRIEDWQVQKPQEDTHNRTGRERFDNAHAEKQKRHHYVNVKWVSALASPTALPLSS